jgi:ATP-dependent protease ClpP protease subunit
LLVPDPNFRPNPNRAIYISGLIDQALVDRLTPAIMQLCANNREPISVYIDSRGGSPQSAETILRLLKATNQDNEQGCHVITVVTTRAASAAADLLSAGDYAIALPDTSILFHGVRTPTWSDLVTMEQASSIADFLKLSNDRYAMTLAKKSERRFMYLFFALQNQFPTYRTRTNKADLPPLECFIGLVREKLSQLANKILDRAWERYERYNALLSHVFALAAKTKKNPFAGSAEAEVESFMLRAIVQFELKKNRADKDWTFSGRGLVRVNDDFFLLQEYFATAFGPEFNQLCERWADLVLSEADNAELALLQDPERSERKRAKVRPHFQPAWSFLVALCHALQEGENEISALDAFWLGLIDEVLGQYGLPLKRYFAEFRPDPKLEEPEVTPTLTPEALPLHVEEEASDPEAPNLPPGTLPTPDSARQVLS